MRNAASSSLKTRGASACSAITPITSSSLPISGTETIDWYFSSSSSGKYLMRGSASALSGMNAGRRCSATQPASPSPRRIETCRRAWSYGSEAARSTSRLPPSSTMKT